MNQVKAGFLLAFMLFLCYNNTRVNFVESPETLLLRLGRFGQEAGVGQYTVTEQANYFLR